MNQEVKRKTYKDKKESNSLASTFILPFSGFLELKWEGKNSCHDATGATGRGIVARDSGGYLGSRSGQSLLLTLMVLAAMVILFTILGRLVLVEQRVTRGYSEILRSELAAKAGAADAENLLLFLFSHYPDSVTYWEPNIADSTTPLAGTVFMYRDLPPEQTFTSTTANSTPTPAPTIYARPLVSGSRTQEFYPVNNFDQTLPSPTDPTKTINLSDPTLAIDLNVPKTFDSKDPNGWIGAMPGQTPISTPVPWVQILADPTKPKDMTIDPTTRQPKNPVVARFAFWIDDESFKLNVNMVKADPRGLASAETKTETINGTSEMLGNPLPSLQGLFGPDVSNISDAATAIVAARNALAVTGGKFLSPFQVGYSSVLPTGETGSTFGRDYKYLMTTQSTGLNLSRSGFKRMNLNDVVTQSLAGLPTKSYGTTKSGPDLSSAAASTQITKAVGQIATAITSNSPHFGQRFYRLGSASQMSVSNATSPNRNVLSVTMTPTGTATFSDEQTYVEKIAANIYDYISPAPNPTVLDKTGKLIMGSPVYSLTDSRINFNYIPFSTTAQINPLLAIGKKAVPYFTEYMMHAKIKAYQEIDVHAGIANYTLEIDHYLEFWNMTNKDITPANGDLGPNPYIVLDNQPYMTMDNGGEGLAVDRANVQCIPRGRPIVIKLNDTFTDSSGNSGKAIVFKADSFTVIATDPDWAVNGAKLKILGPNVYVPSTLYAVNPTTHALTAKSSLLTDPHSAPPYPIPSPLFDSTQLANLREYDCVSADNNGQNQPEIQMGPNWRTTTAMPVVLVGNDYGLFNATVGLNLSMPPGKSNLIAFHADDGFIADNYFRGAYVAGTHPESSDPRATFEAVTVDTSSDADSGCAPGDYSTGNGNLYVKNLGGTAKIQTLGDFNNEILQGSNLAFWPSDISPATANTPATQTAANAPMVVTQGSMLSIGELGNVYDPIRYNSSTSASAVATERGGGRTLTIGQPDVAWDGTRTSATTPEMSYQISPSRSWAAWRLADIFTVKEDTDMAGTAKAEVCGLYNPNGILRDQGQVLQTLLQGITFGNSPDSDPKLAGLALDPPPGGTTIVKGSATSMGIPLAKPGGQAMASYLAARLTRGTSTTSSNLFSPIWEPGELSQLYMLSSSDAINQLVTGVKVSQLNDRGHEELCRRLMDMITTKGNTFSIYVVGQSLNQQGDVMSTKAERVMVRLRPVFSPALDPNFDPTDATQVASRFRKPDSYILEVIQVEDAS